MEKIFEALQREVDKQQYNFGKQDHESIAKRKPLISKKNLLGEHFISISFQTTEKPSWDNVVLLPYFKILEADSDYDRRPELIKMAATIINWIDCLDRNNRCIEPETKIKEFTDNDLMPFGMYRGYKLSVVPASHLLAALENNFVDGFLRDYIVKNKKILEERANHERT